MTTYFYRYVSILKALSDETRLQILQLLTCESLCANALLESFHLTQPTLSYHMKILTRAGLVRAHKKGGFTMYTVNASALVLVEDLMKEFLSAPNLREE